MEIGGGKTLGSGPDKGKMGFLMVREQPEGAGLPSARPCKAFSVASEGRTMT